MSLPERFWNKVNKGDTCWLWTGATNSGGYGTFQVDGRSVLAHRQAYISLVGLVPDGLDLDHLCRVRNCVNPSHLEAVTRSENISRSPLLGKKNARKTHCPKGHGYTLENTYVQFKGSKAMRSCKICRREANNRWYSNAKK